MDWFERLTGFRETSYAETRAKLSVDGDQLRSLANGKSYGIGTFELVSLQALREKAKGTDSPPKTVSVSIVQGDVREMHRSHRYAGALDYGDSAGLHPWNETR